MKYEKYIITKPKPNEAAEFVQSMPPPDIRQRVLYLDDEVVKGAFYVATSWFWKGTGPDMVQAHTHDFDEVLAFLEPTQRMSMIWVERLSYGWKMKNICSPKAL